MNIINSLKESIKNKEARIGIYGLGYVGLPLALRFSEVGFKVTGFDIDKSKVESINKGISFIDHISSERIEAALKSGFTSTSKFSETAECEALIICVPTPLNKYREPDISYILNTLDLISPHLKKGQILSLESTTYPGMTEEEIATRLESQGFSLGEDIFLVYSPEREDPGNIDFDTNTIPKIIGGITPKCLEIGTLVYDYAIDSLVQVSSTKAAEMTKLLENIHRAVNIGLVNEMKLVCDRMDVDVFEVIDAAATKPFGFTPYYPGPGLGGHCIPIDPFYLTWKAREYGLHTRFIELSGEINKQMPHFVVDKLNAGMNRNGKCLSNSKILVLGIAYKKNIDDMRESPSIEIMEILRDSGAEVHYSDPYVKVFPKMREHQFELSSVELTEESIKSYDAVILATDHDDFDYSLLISNSKLLVDCRGRYREKIKNLVNA